MSTGTTPEAGTTKVFPALDHEASTFTYRNFTRREVSENSSIWVADDLSFPENDSRSTPEITDEQLDHLSEAFESRIYPSDTRLFGEPTPRYGTNSSLENSGSVPDDYYQSSDNESRTIILVDNIRDDNYYNESYPVFTAGFYSSAIQRETDRNVVTIDAADWDERLGPTNASWRSNRTDSNATNESDQEAYAVEGTITHELQHLIQNDQDDDETTWLNEGLSEYAEFAAGYGLPDNHVSAFERRPNNSLVEWGDQGDRHILADYGATALFHVYLAQQYGDDVITDLARDPDNGIDSIENVLSESDRPASFYSLYQDFSTALVVDSANVSNQTSRPDRYRFDDISLNVSTTATPADNETAAWGLQSTSIDGVNESLVQFSVNGSRYQPVGWETTTRPGAPNDSSEAVLWSGSDHLRDETAIMEVDLRDTPDPQLTFETYYNIEQGWDVGVVQVSTDGGDTWNSLSNQNTTASLAKPESAHPKVAKHRPGFTGDTDGEWVNESFDLSAYRGDSVLVAFRYLTDWSTAGNDSSHAGTGWYLRDVQVPAAGVTHSGDTTEPFVDISAVRDRPSRYQFTAIAINETGPVDVHQYTPTTFGADSTRSWLSPIRAPPYDRVILLASWAARTNETGAIPYDATIRPFDDVLDSLPPNAVNTAVDRAEHRLRPV